jgi:putative flippase GtrA
MSASFAGIGIAIIVNFLLNHFWTFKEFPAKRNCLQEGKIAEDESNLCDSHV